MGLFGKLQRLVFNESDSVRPEESAIGQDSPIGGKIENVRHSITDLSVEELEAVFAQLPHGTRIEFVTSATVPREEWRAFYLYIEDKLAEKWGLHEKYVESSGDGIKICAIHKEVAEPRTLQKRQKETQAESTSHSVKETGEVGGDIKAVKGKVSSAEAETAKTASKQGSMISNKRTIWECGTLNKDCKLNRRSFVKAGEFCLTTGQSKAEELQREFERTVQAVCDTPSNGEGSTDSEEA